MSYLGKKAKTLELVVTATKKALCRISERPKASYVSSFAPRVAPSPLWTVMGHRLTQQSAPLAPALFAASQLRLMGTGTRGSRGHGWLVNYRDGKGGRHLHGRYHKYKSPDAIALIKKWNDSIFAFNQLKRKKKSTLSGTMASWTDADVPTEVFLDFLVEEWSEPRRVVIELASTVLPKTCSNFAQLCSHGCGLGTAAGNYDDGHKKLTLGYRNTIVHKIEKSVGLLLGDVYMKGGDSGACHPSVADLPNGHYFSDEGFVLSHGVSEVGGIVSMLSSGVNRNESRFVITTQPAYQLDGRYVAFGRVKEGMQTVLEIGNVFTRRGRPASKVVVVDCGVVRL